MANLLVEKRDIDFILYEQFDIVKLTEKEKFSDFSKDEFDMVLEQALKFSEDMLAPSNKEGDEIGAKWDNGNVTLPESFYKPLQEFGDAGWVSMSDDPEAGGQGLPLIIYSAANEYFYAANVAITLYPNLAHGSAKMIELFGTDEQKKKYMDKLYNFDWAGTMCLTESGAGSDLAHVATKAIKIDDTHYKIVGQKIFISGGEYDAKPNNIHPVLARIEGDPEGVKGISIFIVPKHKVNDDGSIGEFNDVTCTGIEHKMGLKGSSTCQLSFGDNGDCIGELLGDARKGITIMFYMMNEERLNVGLQGVALSSAAYLNALDYARERYQGTNIEAKGASTELLPIIKHPDIRQNLLWMKSYVEGLRALNYYTAILIDKKNSETDNKDYYTGLIEFLTPICKAYSTDWAYDICEKAIQIYGGYGFCQDYPVEQYARDSKIGSLYEGTNGIQAIDLLGRKLRMADGKIFKSLTDEIDATIDEATKNKSLVMHAGIVRESKDNLIKVANHLMSLIKAGSVSDAFLSASPFLDVVGDTILGWMHLWQLKVAQEKLDEIFNSKGVDSEEKKAALINENKEVAFYSGKVHSARFFITKILPMQKSKVEIIMNDEFDANKIDDNSFGEVMQK